MNKDKVVNLRFGANLEDVPQFSGKTPCAYLLVKSNWYCTEPVSISLTEETAINEYEKLKNALIDEFNKVVIGVTKLPDGKARQKNEIIAHKTEMNELKNLEYPGDLDNCNLWKPCVLKISLIKG